MEDQAIIALISRHLEAKQWDTATHLCQQLLASNPHSFAGYRMLGQASIGLDKLEQAIEAYIHCLELRPQQVSLYADLGYLYHRTQQYANAIAHYQKALSQRSPWIEVTFNLGVIHHHLGDWNAAIEYYQQVIQHNQTHSKALFNLARLYEQRGQLPDAEKAYILLTTLQPNDFSPFSNLGQVLFRQNRLEESLKAFTDALALKPTSAKLWNNLGQVYWSLDKQEEALHAHHKALTLDPQLTSSRLLLGRLYRQHQHYEQAEQHIQHLCHHSPSSIEAHHEWGLLSIELGNWSHAFSCFRQILADQSAWVDLFCHRVSQLPRQDWYEQAQSEAGAFLHTLLSKEATPICLEHLFNSYQYLGRALLEYGAPQQAEASFHKALQIKPSCIDLYSELGKCLVQQDRFNAAITVFKIGLTLDPNHPQVCSQLEHLLRQQGEYPNTMNSDEGFQATPPSIEDSRPAPRISTPQFQGIYPSTKDWVHLTASTSSISPPTYVEITPHSSPPDVLSPIKLTASSKQPSTDCGGVTCQACMSDLIDVFQPRQLGENFFQCSFTSSSIQPSPSTFVAHIPEGQAWIAPQHNAWLICKTIAIITPDQYLLGDVSRFYPWYLPGCLKHDLTQHPILELTSIPSPQEIPGTVAILSGLSGHVFYHWMIDVIPRIGLLKASGIELDKIDGFVVNSLTKSFQKETLQTLGIPLEKVIESDRTPSIKAQTLIVPSFPGHLDWVPQATIDFLRDHFLETEQSAPSQRIYISRSQAKYRQVVNEAEVIQLLAQFGFVSVHLEGLTVADQARLFASAEVIIAPHGAALTNLVFCQEGTKVIEVFSPNYIRTDYWMVSQQRQLEHFYILGQSFQGSFLRKLMHQNSLTEDISIELKTLYVAMNHLGLVRQ